MKRRVLGNHPRDGPRGPGPPTLKKRKEKKGVNWALKSCLGHLGPSPTRTYQPRLSSTRKDKPFNVIPN